MSEILDRTTLKALSTYTRQDIIKLLAKRPYTASELSKILDKHVTTITEHLNVLEASGLIAKKEGTNKWVYYTLTGKGEKLFKPNFYSWVVVLSISAVFMITGLLRVFRTDMAYGTADKNAPLMTSLPQAGEAATTVTRNVSTTIPAAPFDIAAFALIALALIGFGFVGYKIIMNNSRKHSEFKIK